MTPTALYTVALVLLALMAVTALAAVAVEWATERGWLDDVGLPWEGEGS